MEVSCSAALLLAFERELSSREVAAAVLGARVAILLPVPPSRWLPVPFLYLSVNSMFTQN